MSKFDEAHQTKKFPAVSLPSDFLPSMSLSLAKYAKKSSKSMNQFLHVFD